MQGSSATAQEVKYAKELLQKMYNVDIIPKKYRNIGCAYFIYDFFSTSKESLSNIFLHLDLDEIERRINQIIANQSQIIINQAKMIAQNDEMINQNQCLLKGLAEVNDSVKDVHSAVISAKQWTQIAANNAEACAWIGLANYLK